MRDYYGYPRRRRRHGRRGRVAVSKTDLRYAALFIVAYVLLILLFKAGIISPLFIAGH